MKAVIGFVYVLRIVMKRVLLFILVFVLVGMLKMHKVECEGIDFA
jgi:hypothetical protein